MAKIFPFITLLNENNEQIIITLNKWIIFVLNILKLHLSFQYTLLTCISGVDLLSTKYRFVIIYELLSLTNNLRTRIKIFINEIDLVMSSMSIFKSANWWEREIWDMFGIYFKNHLDLRRILSDYGFEGFPLRKDFPLSGYVEARYDSIKKKIILEPISLAQEYRFYSFNLPWE